MVKKAMFVVLVTVLAIIVHGYYNHSVNKDELIGGKWIVAEHGKSTENSDTASDLQPQLYTMLFPVGGTVEFSGNRDRKIVLMGTVCDYQWFDDERIILKGRNADSDVMLKVNFDDNKLSLSNDAFAVNFVKWTPEVQAKIEKKQK